MQEFSKWQNFEFLKVFGDNDLFETYKLRVFRKLIQTINVAFKIKLMNIILIN